MKTTKKLLALALSLTMVSSAMPLANAALDNWKDDDLYHQDFQDESATPLGDVPQSLFYWWPGESANDPSEWGYTIESATGKTGKATNVLKLDKKRAGGQDGIDFKNYFQNDLPGADALTSTNSKVVYEFYMNVSDADTEWQFGLKDNAGAFQRQFGIDRNKSTAYYTDYTSGSAVITGVSIATNYWVRYSWVIDNSTQKQSLYVDGTPVFEDVDFYGTTKANGLKINNAIGKWGSPSVLMFDEISIYNYDESRVFAVDIIPEEGWYVPTEYRLAATCDNNSGWTNQQNAPQGMSFERGVMKYETPAFSDQTTSLYDNTLLYNDVKSLFIDDFGSWISNPLFDATNTGTYQLRFKLPAGNKSEITIYGCSYVNSWNQMNMIGLHPSGEGYELRVPWWGADLVNINADQWYVLAINMYQPDITKPNYKYSVYLDGKPLFDGKEFDCAGDPVGPGGSSGSSLERLGIKMGSAWTPKPENAPANYVPESKYACIYVDNAYIYEGEPIQTDIIFDDVYVAEGDTTDAAYIGSPVGFELVDPHYTSANPDIASVDETTGTITGLKAGRAIVNVTANAGMVNKSFLVTVGDVSFDVIESSVSANVADAAEGGKTIELTSTVSNKSSSVQDVVFVAAVVNENGTIVQTLKTEPKVLGERDSATDVATYTASYTLAEGSTDKVVLFVWDSLGSMKPVTYPLAYGLNGWVSNS